MKSERGVTLTSLMIYVVAFTVIVLAIGRITTYFYKNVNQIDSNTNAEEQYTKFSSYFTYEINIEGNEVELCEKEGNIQYIVFSLTENQYTYQNGNIYRNKTKIVKNVEECEFKYNEDKTIDIYIKINGKEYRNSYKVIN